MIEMSEAVRQNMSNSNLPPFVSPDDRVILFDGVCKLCNVWSRFILTYDREHKFRLATVQSEAGQAILAHFGLPLDHFDTMLLVEGPVAYEKSTAFLQVVRQLPAPFYLLWIFRLIPVAIRDWLYDHIAQNRYRIFGKYDQCLLPTPEHQQRFL